MEKCYIQWDIFIKDYQEVLDLEHQSREYPRNFKSIELFIEFNQIVLYIVKYFMFCMKKKI